MTSRGLAYCQGPAKRFLDMTLTLVALVGLSPLYFAIAMLVLLGSGPPVLFRQERVGRDGRLFNLLKFRTMTTGASAGPLVTARGDPRITPVGRWLRATKFDELPQLVNVLRGHMSLVGPRPEVPRYVAVYTPEQRRVLVVRPGLTDPATVLFRAEETILGAVGQDERDRHYSEEILPRKLALNLEYMEHASLVSDLGLILKTARLLVWPWRR